MNRKMISYVLGRVFLAEFFLMIPSVIVGLIYKESEALSFALPMVILLAAGLIFGMKKPQNTVIYVRDGFFIVVSLAINSAISARFFSFSRFCFVIFSRSLLVAFKSLASSILI